MKCPICAKPLVAEEKAQCKECGKYVHKGHLKKQVCYKCDMTSRLLLEKLERQGYLKTK